MISVYHVTGSYFNEQQRKSLTYSDGYYFDHTKADRRKNVLQKKYPDIEYTVQVIKVKE